jgi:hypothetical protein
MIPIEFKRKSNTKISENQDSTDGGSGSNQDNFVQRKRGFSLSKHHFIQFDRKYKP